MFGNLKSNGKEANLLDCQKQQYNYRCPMKDTRFYKSKPDHGCHSCAKGDIMYVKCIDKPSVAVRLNTIQHPREGAVFAVCVVVGFEII